MADWLRAAADQARACRAANGAQSVGPVGSGQTVPFTPGGFASSALRFWSDNLGNVMSAARAEGKDVGGAALLPITTVGAGPLQLSRLARLVADSTGSIAVKQSADRIDRALISAFLAVAGGGALAVANGRGVLCLDENHAPIFWNAIGTLSREYQFLSGSTSIPFLEFWLDVAPTPGEIGDQLKTEIHGVGVVAGEALAAAGEAVGTGVAGVAKGLGIVNVGVLLAGGYVAARYVL